MSPTASCAVRCDPFGGVRILRRVRCLQGAGARLLRGHRHSLPQPEGAAASRAQYDRAASDRRRQSARSDGAGLWSILTLYGRAFDEPDGQLELRQPARHHHTCRARGCHPQDAAGDRGDAALGRHADGGVRHARRGAPVPDAIVKEVRDAGIPFFRSPERALRALARFATWADAAPEVANAAAVPAARLPAGIIPEHAAKDILERAGLRMPARRLVTTSTRRSRLPPHSAVRWRSRCSRQRCRTRPKSAASSSTERSR